LPFAVLILGCVALSLLSQLVVAIWANIWTILLIVISLALTAAVVAAIIRITVENRARRLLRELQNVHRALIADHKQWKHRALLAEQRLEFESRVTNSIPPRRVKQLILLCHPDKHANSALANDVTKWLLTLRAGSGC
jgi:hypothetical protein